MIENYWPFWQGGMAIALVAVLITLISGKFLGVTRGYASACAIFSKAEYFSKKDYGGKFGIRTLFSIGLITGGFLAALSTGSWDPKWEFGQFDVIWGSSLGIKFTVLILGGFLWGYGSRMAKGCTSGNSISGIAKGSLASLMTTLCFMIAGIILTFLINGLMGNL